MQRENTYPNKLELNADLGMLVGLLLTDGCVIPKEGKVVLTNKSEELHKVFRESITRAFGNVNFLENFNINGVKNTTINNKRIVNELLNFTPTFRTRQFDDGTFPPAKIPEFFGKIHNRELCKILQVMFSADGSIILRVRWHKLKRKWEILREIRLASKHPKLKEQISELLKKLDFNPIIRKDCIALDRKNDLIKFSKKIRFVDGVKVTKNKIWGGKIKMMFLTYQ